MSARDAGECAANRTQITGQVLIQIRAIESRSEFARRVSPPVVFATLGEANEINPFRVS
jgi:hypothetical protein